MMAYGSREAVLTENKLAIGDNSAANAGSNCDHHEVGQCLPESEAHFCQGGGMRIIDYISRQVKVLFSEFTQSKSCPPGKILCCSKNAPVLCVDCTSTCNTQPDWLNTVVADHRENLANYLRKASGNDTSSLARLSWNLFRELDFSVAFDQGSFNGCSSDIHADRWRR